MYSDEEYLASLKDVKLALDIAKKMDVNPKMAVLLTTILDFSTALMTQNDKLRVLAEAYSMKKYGKVSDEVLDEYIRAQEDEKEREDGFLGYV